MGQLTTYSREARELNFNKSLLQRLFELYQKQARIAAEASDFNREFAMQTMNEFGEFENPFMCSLVANYRSRPQIVNYLSTVFYGNPRRLKPMAQLREVRSVVMQPALTLYMRTEWRSATRRAPAGGMPLRSTRSLRAYSLCSRTGRLSNGALSRPMTSASFPTIASRFNAFVRASERKQRAGRSSGRSKSRAS